MILFKNNDSVFRRYNSDLHNKTFYATQITIVHRRVSVVSYINAFQSYIFSLM